MQVEGGNRISIEWKCSSVVHEDTHEFAKELERQLNLASQEGYALAQMIFREPDKGLVLVHQRAIVDRADPLLRLAQIGDELQ